MSTWADVTKGSRVELKGREYTVAKIKTKGKRTRVTVVGSAGKFEAEVKTKDTVTIVTARDKRRDSAGWYKPTKAERKAAEAEQSKGLPTGDPTVTKPPVKTKGGDPWESRRDKVERMLDDVLSAHLVGEATDENVGYYVPPVDVSTVTAHLVLFHGEQPSDWDDVMQGAALLERHAALHDQHLDDPEGQPLKVNHWHTKERPTP